MHRDVDIRRARVKALADHQTGLAMRVAPRTQPLDGGVQGEIPRPAGPDKVKRVVGEPHVLTPARHPVSAVRRVERHRASPAGLAHVALALEQTQIGRVCHGSKIEEKADDRNDKARPPVPGANGAGRVHTRTGESLSFHGVILAATIRQWQPIFGRAQSSLLTLLYGSEVMVGGRWFFPISYSGRIQTFR